MDFNPVWHGYNTNGLYCFVISNYGGICPLYGRDKPSVWGNFPHCPLLTQCGMDIIQMNFCCFVFSNFVALFLVIEITNYIAYPEMSDISSYGGLSPIAPFMGDTPP